MSRRINIAVERRLKATTLSSRAQPWRGVGALRGKVRRGTFGSARLNTRRVSSEVKRQRAPGWWGCH